MDIDNIKQKMQYILDENGELTEILNFDVKPVENPIKYKLKNAFEVFVLVEGTENYWISNYGRCINNLNHKDKNTFYEHKQGKVHYTIYDIERILKKDKRGRLTGEIEVNRHKRETSPEDLVADAFLKSYRGRCKIWHKDGDYSNNWYKNLLYVTNDDYIALKAGKIKWQSLNYAQEYIEYKNRASYEAMIIYNSIKMRTYNARDKDYIGECYNDATMGQLWIAYPKDL